MAKNDKTPKMAKIAILRFCQFPFLGPGFLGSFLKKSKMTIFCKMAIFAIFDPENSVIASRKGGRFLKGLKVPIFGHFSPCTYRYKAHKWPFLGGRKTALLRQVDSYPRLAESF